MDLALSGLTNAMRATALRRNRLDANVPTVWLHHMTARIFLTAFTLDYPPHISLVPMAAEYWQATPFAVPPLPPPLPQLLAALPGTWETAL